MCPVSLNSGLVQKTEIETSFELVVSFCSLQRSLLKPGVFRRNARNRKARTTISHWVFNSVRIKALGTFLSSNAV